MFYTSRALGFSVEISGSSVKKHFAFFMIHSAVWLWVGFAFNFFCAPQADGNGYLWRRLFRSRIHVHDSSLRTVKGASHCLSQRLFSLRVEHLQVTDIKFHLHRSAAKDRTFFCVILRYICCRLTGYTQLHSLPPSGQTIPLEYSAFLCPINWVTVLLNLLLPNTKQLYFLFLS